MDYDKHIENSSLRPIAPVFMPKNNTTLPSTQQVTLTTLRGIAPDFKPAAPVFPPPKRAPFMGNDVYSSIHIRKALNSPDIEIDRFEWNDRSLAPYNKPRYRKLWLERRNARKILDHLVKSTFEERLPAEIRVQIYELLLCHDYIELAAKSNETCDWDVNAQNHHRSRFKMDILPGLRILRLNSKIRNEAVPVFYGSNEFRFTYVKGWTTLAAWIRQIGCFNLQFFRKITVHVLWKGAVMDGFFHIHQEEYMEMVSANKHLLKVGLRPSYKFSESRRASCVRYVKRTLEKFGKLGVFRLVIPDSFSPEPRDSRDWDLKRSVAESNPPQYQANFVLDRSKFENLQVLLDRLHGGFANHRNFDPGLADRWRAESLWHSLSAHDKATERGIELINAPYDHLGRWPVPVEEGDEMLEVDGQTLKKILS